MSIAKSAATASLAVAFALSLTACSAPTIEETTVDTADAESAAALQTLVDESQSVIPDLMAEFGTTYSDIRILADPPRTLVYEYDFTDELDPDVATETFDGQIDQLQAACESDIFPGMIDGGVADPAVRFAYFNADGSELWEYTCE